MRPGEACRRGGAHNRGVTFSVRRCRDDDEDLAAWAAVVSETDPANPTSLEQLRWEAATYPGGQRLVAERRGQIVGAAATGRIYMYPPDMPLAWLTLGVAAPARRAGIGTALWSVASEHARAAGKSGFQCDVDGTSADGIAFLEHRGFGEYERMRAVRLDLRGLDLPPATVPEGTALVTLAERPDLLRGVHSVALAAFGDIPHGETPMIAGELEEFTARDVDRPGIPHDAFVIAVDDTTGAVVGYASLLLLPGSTTVAWHDMTAVHPSARGRGIARAMKEHTIRWALDRGLEALETGNDTENAPMRAVNARLGYRPLPDRIAYRGPLHT